MSSLSTIAPGASALGCVMHAWNGNAPARPAAIGSEPRGLILDLDDTLYPREHYVQSGLKAVARHLEAQHGIPAIDSFMTMSAARRGDQKGLELQAACERYELPLTMVAVLVDVIRVHRPTIHLPRETAAVLASLVADGWQLVVLTNGLPSMQRRKVEALGLTRLVRHIVFADEHAPGGKPSPVVFHEALRHLGVAAGRVIMVGDDPICDIAGARRVGLKTVRVATSERTSLLEPGADAVIDSLHQLPDVAAALMEAVSVHAA